MGTPTTILGPQHKSFPPASWGQPVRKFLDNAVELSQFQTPVLTLNRPALEHNTATMMTWARQVGLSLAPHGKTTMAPALWQQLLDAGAWGLTLATPWQAQVARAAGCRRILIANTVVDPVGLTWLAHERAAHPDVDLLCWADSPATVMEMDTILAAAGAEQRVPVLAELGADGGRTGARGLTKAVGLATMIASSHHLELAGVGGYEGALAHDRSDASLTRIDTYLDELRALHFNVRGLVRADTRPIVTAGGSAYFDRVAARLSGLRDTDVVLRSGAFQIHDDGFYADITPMGRHVGETPFRSAMHAWLRVISRPEPGLALLDGGKRDLSFDEGLPTPQRIAGRSAVESQRILADSRITALNDQHAFLELAPGTSAEDLPVGTVLRLGLSHPCTALDKWRLIPVIEDADQPHPRVTDAIETIF
ncbi:MAG: amino acid deaminase [Propioniciclava sp.]